MRGCAYMPCVIVHMWVSVCACVPMCTWSRVCACVCVFMYTSVQMHVCMHVSVCVYVCMCGHTCLCASRKRTWGLTLAKLALYHRGISFAASNDLVVFLIFTISFETGSCNITQTGLILAVSFKQAFDLPSSCLSLLSD